MRMTIEDAIKKLGILKIFDNPDLSEAVKMAVFALCAQQKADKLGRSRWEWNGCTVCESECCELCVYCHVRMDDYPCEKCVTVSGNLNEYRAVNFCYKCGRPLTNEAWADLEWKIGG